MTLKRCYGIMILFLSLFTAANGQLERGGTPISWSLSQELNEGSGWQTLPAINRDDLRNEDELSSSNKSIPYRFAYAHSVNYTLSNSGQWTTLRNGDRIWILGVECVDAFSIGLTFADVDLPRGGRLYVYSQDHQDFIGPMSSNDNTDSYLGIPHVSGSKVYVEYYEPFAFRGTGSFSIRYVAEAYKDLSEVLANAESGCYQLLDNSGSIPAVINASSSVMQMMVDNGQRIATATLMNNSSSDATPYAFAASSSLIGNPSSWVFLFDNIGVNCAGFSSILGCRKTAICGAEVLKSDFPQGISLLQLNDHPRNNWQTYYSGWRLDAPVNPSAFTCVQHAFGLPQSISSYSGQLEVLSFNTQNTRALSYREEGITGQGSLGSPLFDSEMNMIGIFVGGDSYCDGSGKDYFVLLRDSWSQFSAYLDPFEIVEDKISGFYPKIGQGGADSDGLDIFFFPNPAQDWIYIQNDGDVALDNVIIHNSNGKLVKEFKPQVPTVMINDLPNGLYSITFIAGNERKVEKLLVR